MTAPDSTGYPVGADALDPRGVFRSTLWFDQPDAHEHIAAWAGAGRIDEELVVELRRFVDDGYLTLDLDLDPGIYEEIDQSVERLWREKPQHVAFAYRSRLTPFPCADEAEHRKPSYRIADLHSVSSGAETLYLNPRVFEVVNLLFGEQAVASQSLYFEYGSFQPLHRDPVHVPATPPWNLLAAWFALEDIDPRSGVLAYAPGSHRLPYYRFPSGDYRFDASHHADHDAERMAAFETRQCEEAGIPVQYFVPKKGGVLIWHHSLLHGAPKAEDPSLSRKSFVVHFTTRAHMQRRRGEFVEHVPGRDGAMVSRLRLVETEDVRQRGSAVGFDNPLKKYRVRTPA
jgi:hypothetical protein